MVSYKPLVGISSNSQLSCSLAQGWTDEILRSKGQRSRSRQDQIFLN